MKVFSQTIFVDPYVLPGDCMKNVNDPVVGSYREDNKRAVFKYSLTVGNSQSSCTGSLINRNTDEYNLGQYFVTSWHCFKEGDMCDGGDFDFNRNVTFYFNFQSPPDHLDKVFTENFNGNRYTITRTLRLVEHVTCAYGDFALCEILGDPIPPHFNPYYVGWEPSGFSQFDSFITMGHPNSSIKVAAATNYAQDGLFVNPVYTSCIWVTKIIDFLIGWITGHKSSLEQICTYTQIPFIDTRYAVGGYNYGSTAKGSSGSGLFNSANKLVGTLSGNILEGNCNSQNDYYGKFKGYYTQDAIKNTLNPPNDWSIDQIGLLGRPRNCYASVVYNYGTPFVFYPAKYYQAQNSIVINSNSFIKLGIDSYPNNVTIANGADFTFNAVSSVDLGPGFESETGATFTANTGVVCNNSSAHRLDDNVETSYTNSAKQDLYARVNAIKIPEHMELDESLTQKKIVLALYPNPASSVIQVGLISLPRGNVDVAVFDSYGRPAMNYNFDFIGQKEISLPVESLSNGLYEIIFSAQGSRSVQKIVILK